MSDTVKVTVDRASVAMGDDVDSHREFWVYPASATIDDLLVEISSHYVPGIAGPAGWCVYLDNDDRSRHGKSASSIAGTTSGSGITSAGCCLERRP